MQRIKRIAPQGESLEKDMSIRDHALILLTGQYRKNFAGGILKYSNHLKQLKLKSETA